MLLGLRSQKDAAEKSGRLVESRKGLVANSLKTKLRRACAVSTSFRKKPDGMHRLVCSVDSSAARRARQWDLSKQEKERLKARLGITEDIGAIYRVFKYFDFNDSGALKEADVHLVLAELGVQPSKPEEYSRIRELAAGQKLARQREFGFEEFLVLMCAAQGELRSFRWTDVLRQFDGAGGAVSGRLTRSQVNHVLGESFMLAPQNSEEEREIDRLFKEVEKRASSGLALHEFEEFVERARMALSMRRSEDALSLAKAMGLEPATIAEFRWDLQPFWKIFERYSTRNLANGGERFLANRDINLVLLDAGVFGWTDASMPLAVIHLPLGVCDFSAFVDIVHDIREASKSIFEKPLKEKFKHYARYNRGLYLTKSDIYGILSEFEMMPKSREEQQHMAAVIDRFDINGSGKFEFNEFEAFYLRLQEQHRQFRQEKEYKAAREQKFGKRQVAKLRRWYLNLLPNDEGQVTQYSIAVGFSSLHEELAGHPSQPRSFVNRLQACPDRLVDFAECARIVQLGMQDARDELDDPDAFPPLDDDEDSVTSELPVPAHLKPDREDIEASLDAQYHAWLWSEVTHRRRRIDDGTLSRLELSRDTQPFPRLQDEQAWQKVRGALVEHLAPSLGTSKINRVLPASIDLAVPVFCAYALSSATSVGDMHLRSNFTMQLLGVEFMGQRGVVQALPEGDMRVTKNDRLWFGFEGRNLRRGHMERFLSEEGARTADWDLLQWSLLPLFPCQPPPELIGLTLRECNFEHVYGAIICGLGRGDDGIELFPADTWRIDGTTKCIFLYLLSPVKFLSRMSAISCNSCKAQLFRKLDSSDAMIQRPDLFSNSAPQAPLAQVSEEGSSSTSHDGHSNVSYSRAGDGDDDEVDY